MSKNTTPLENEIKELIRVAEADHPYLGSCYYNGRGVERDLQKAFYWHKKSAEQQDTPSVFYTLYMCYTDGRGVRKNRRLALENLRKSAELGYPKARKVLKKMESVE